MVWELSDPENKNSVFIFEFAGTNVFFILFGVVCSTQLLLLLLRVTSGTQPGLFVNVYHCFPTPDIYT